MNPNTVQYGGDHYIGAGNLQHWDMLPVFGYGWEYYVGRATAYLTRVKQPELDPKKANHFVDKLVWLIDNGLVPPAYDNHTTRTVAELNHYLADVYFPANNIRITSKEAMAISALMFARTRADLLAAKHIIVAIDLDKRPDDEVRHANRNDDRVFVVGDSGE